MCPPLLPCPTHPSYLTLSWPGADGFFWRLKVAVTVVLAVSVTVQEPAPEQPPPLQPEKAEPAAGVAVRVTAVPLG